MYPNRTSTKGKVQAQLIFLIVLNLIFVRNVYKSKRLQRTGRSIQWLSNNRSRCCVNQMSSYVFILNVMYSSPFFTIFLMEVNL